MTRISQEMYRRNIELSEINKALSLLRTIDALVLESQESLPELCQKIAQEIAKANDYAFVGVLTRTSYLDEQLVLYGWSVQGNSAEASFTFNKPPHIKIDHEWFGSPQRSGLLSLEMMSIAQLALLIGCSEEEINNLKAKV